MLKNVKNRILACSGVSVGRNVFRFKDFTRMIRAVKVIVHEDAHVEAAAAQLERKANLCKQSVLIAASGKQSYDDSGRPRQY